MEKNELARSEILDDSSAALLENDIGKSVEPSRFAWPRAATHIKIR